MGGARASTRSSVLELLPPVVVAVVPVPIAATVAPISVIVLATTASSAEITAVVMVIATSVVVIVRPVVVVRLSSAHAPSVVHAAHATSRVVSTTASFVLAAVSVAGATVLSVRRDHSRLVTTSTPSKQIIINKRNSK